VDVDHPGGRFGALDVATNPERGIGVSAEH